MGLRGCLNRKDAAGTAARAYSATIYPALFAKVNELLTKRVQAKVAKQFEVADQCVNGPVGGVASY